MMIGKGINKKGEKCFFKVLSDGTRMEIKKTKEGFKEVGPLDPETKEEKRIKKLGNMIKAAEIRGDVERIKVLEAELAELTQ